MATQQDLALHFSGNTENRFTGIPWETRHGGAPVFPGVAAWLDCTVHARIDAGDFAGLAELFEHARMVGPDGAVQGEGVDGIRSIYERSTQLYEDGSPMTQHVTTNLIFDFAADTQPHRRAITIVTGTSAKAAMNAVARCSNG